MAGNKQPCCRREAARCFVLSGVSFNSLVGLRRAHFPRSASDLLLRTNKFCSLLDVVDSWSCKRCMLYAVINIDSLMRRRLCDKLHGGRSHLLMAHCSIESSIDSQLFVQNRDLCIYATCIRRPRQWSSLEYCHDVWYAKLQWCGYTRW